MTAPATRATPAEERLARARAVLAGVEGRLGISTDLGLDPVTGEVLPAPPGEKALPVDRAVAPLLPGEILRRGTVVSVEGSTSLILALLARASREGSWAAIVGLPHVGVVAAARRGIDLSRLALVPAPGVEAPTVVAACLDGMDVVVLGPRLALSDADSRRLAARARERGAVLVSAGPHPGTHVALRVVRSEWTGLGAGEGRLRERTVVVARSGRHLGAPDEVAVALDTEGASTRLGVSYTDRAAEARRILRLA